MLSFSTNLDVNGKGGLALVALHGTRVVGNPGGLHQKRGIGGAVPHHFSVDAQDRRRISHGPTAQRVSNRWEYHHDSAWSSGFRWAG